MLPFSSFTWAIFLSHNLAVWVGNVVLYAIYHLDLFSSYKIQPAKWPERELVVKAVQSLLFETVVVLPVLTHFVIEPVFLWRGMAPSSPGWPIVLLQFCICFLVTDATFYWSHRTLHHPLFYARIHKKHHSFKTSLGIAAEYSHPVETALNTISTLLGPFLLGMDANSLCLFMALRVWETLDAHSGYRLPFSPWGVVLWVQGGAERHDFHHSKNIGNFGMLAFWDRWMGTDRAFKEFKAKQVKTVK
jgi:methylsterol monooxygenase